MTSNAAMLMAALVLSGTVLAQSSGPSAGSAEAGQGANLTTTGQAVNSGKKTGVPAEACYWTADGGTKKNPTWVLLNELAGKPGPTFCPDCNRLVVGHNPAPGPAGGAAIAKLPPKRDDYAPPNKHARTASAPIDRAE